MQTFAVTGANNTILAIAVVAPSSNSDAPTNNTPLIVGLVVGLGGGLMLIIAGGVVTLIYYRRHRSTGKVWASSKPIHVSGVDAANAPEDIETNEGKGSAMH